MVDFFSFRSSFRSRRNCFLASWLLRTEGDFGRLPEIERSDGWNVWLAENLLLKLKRPTLARFIPHLNLTLLETGVVSLEVKV